MREKRVIVLLAFGLLASLAAEALAQEPKPAVLPATVTDTYAAKFICGVVFDPGINAVPDAQPGRYATKINVHNNTGMLIKFRKKFIRLRGGEEPISPIDVKPLEELKPDYAMEVVCTDIYKMLHIPVGGTTPPVYIEGFVILEVYYSGTVPPNVPVDPLDVEGIYTYAGNLPGSSCNTGVSIDVVVYPVKRNRHFLQ